MLIILHFIMFILYSCHPYIFFNKDHNSMTFIGFSVKDNGDLIDPDTKKVIHRQLFTRQLLRGLQAQRVILTDHHSSNQLVMQSMYTLSIFTYIYIFIYLFIYSGKNYYVNY